MEPNKYYTDTTKQVTIREYNIDNIRQEINEFISNNVIDNSVADFDEGSYYTCDDISDLSQSSHPKLVVHLLCTIPNRNKGNGKDFIYEPNGTFDVSDAFRGFLEELSIKAEITIRCPIYYLPKNDRR